MENWECSFENEMCGTGKKQIQWVSAEKWYAAALQRTAGCCLCTGNSVPSAW